MPGPPFRAPDGISIPLAARCRKHSFPVDVVREACRQCLKVCAHLPRRSQVNRQSINNPVGRPEEQGIGLSGAETGDLACFEPSGHPVGPLDRALVRLRKVHRHSETKPDGRREAVLQFPVLTSESVLHWRNQVPMTYSAASWRRPQPQLRGARGLSRRRIPSTKRMIGHDTEFTMVWPFQRATKEAHGRWSLISMSTGAGFQQIQPSSEASFAARGVLFMAPGSVVVQAPSVRHKVDARQVTRGVRSMYGPGVPDAGGGGPSNINVSRIHPTVLVEFGFRWSAVACAVISWAPMSKETTSSRIFPLPISAARNRDRETECRSMAVRRRI